MAELFGKILLFNTVYVNESLLLTLANRDLSSETAEELRFILRDLEFLLLLTEGLSLLWTQ